MRDDMLRTVRDVVVILAVILVAAYVYIALTIAPPTAPIVKATKFVESILGGKE